MSQNRFSPRKSGRQSRARETVEAIVQASRLLVSREGLERLTTNRIAELAGVSVGSLYQYFPGKDAVVHALLEREFNRSVDDLLAIIEAIDPACVPLDEAVGRIVDRVFDSQAERRPVYRELCTAALSFTRLRFTLDNDARVLAAVREKLKGYGAEVDPESLDLATFVALYALKGVQLGVVFIEHPADDARLRSILKRMACACVTAPARNVSSPAPAARTASEPCAQSA